MRDDEQILDTIKLAKQMAKTHAYKYKQDLAEITDYLLEKVAILWLRYDKTRGISFRHYASSSLKGYLLNYLRDQTRSIRIPRRLLYLYLREQALLKKSFVYESDEAIAADLGVTLQELRDCRQAVQQQTTSLTELAKTYDSPLTCANAAIEYLRDSPLEDISLLEMRYQDKMSWQAIAKELNKPIAEVIARANELLRNITTLVNNDIS